MTRFLVFTLSILYTSLGMNPTAVRAGTNVWTSIGPDGGRVQAITVDPQNPDTVYAVAGGAIFKTTDGAANWKRVYSPATSNGLANYPATLVAIHPPRLQHRVRRHRHRRSIQEHGWRSELEHGERRAAKTDVVPE